MYANSVDSAQVRLSFRCDKYQNIVTVLVKSKGEGATWFMLSYEYVKHIKINKTLKWQIRKNTLIEAIFQSIMF